MCKQARILSFVEVIMRWDENSLVTYTALAAGNSLIKVFLVSKSSLKQLPIFVVV